MAAKHIWTRDEFFKHQLRVCERTPSCLKRHVGQGCLGNWLLSSLPKMTDNSGDRIPGTFLLKLGSYLVSTRLATYCSNMVTHKIFCTRANSECHGGHCCTWDSCCLWNCWSRLAFGDRSQRMKGTNKDSWIGEQITFSWLFLSPHASTIDVFAVSVVKTELLGWLGLLLSGDAVRKRTSLWATGMAHKLWSPGNAWNSLVSSMALSCWCQPANAWLLSFFLFASLFKKHSAKGNELELRCKRQFGLTEVNAYWLQKY